jgi:HoxN/HupN/NixA family high-affinity nickel-transporter
MVFPALFTAGMTLVDTTDSILMLGAYSWAFLKPIRKLYYNLTITGVSVVVAVIVGGLETLNLVGDQLGLTDSGGFWGAVGSLNPYRQTLRCLGGGNSQKTDLGRRIEAKTEENAQRVHLPAAPDQPE